MANELKQMTVSLTLYRKWYAIKLKLHIQKR